MERDIIAENQTEQMIQLLLNGDADAKAQQAALGWTDEEVEAFLSRCAKE